MNLPRMWDWILMALLSMVAVYAFAPAQMPVLLYKFSMLSLATIVAYWIDKSLFARLKDRLDATSPRDLFSASRVMARALIFLAVVLGITLGV